MTQDPKAVPPEEPPAVVSFGRRVSALAAQHPLAPAVTVVKTSGEFEEMSWGELEVGTRAVARLLRDRGCDDSSRVVIALSRESAFVVHAVAAWRLGACVVPFNPVLPALERRRLLDLARPVAVIAGEGWAGERDVIDPSLYRSVSPLAPSELDDPIALPGKAMPTGGSTGAPKLIVDQHPWAFVPGNPPTSPITGLRPGQRQLVTGPLNHNSPFANAFGGLFQDHHLFMMEKFDGVRAVELIDRLQINYLALVPAQMKRMLEPARLHPESVRSIQAILHTGAVCPPWLKQAWIDLIGGERIFEMFGSTEGMGLTAIRGDEWLAHRGSVGRPWRSTIKILGPDQEELPPLEVGEIYGLPIDGAAHFAYVGIERTRITPDGHMSVGDLGWLDDEGFLFVADRRQDVIISGGINIYPAEVEGVMLEQAGVEDVVVVGRADEEWGRRVHAIVQTSAGDGPTIDEMRTYCRAHLSSEKVPKTFEIVERLPRDEAGKVRRSAL